MLEAPIEPPVNSTMDLSLALIVRSSVPLVPPPPQTTPSSFPPTASLRFGLYRGGE